MCARDARCSIVLFAASVAVAAAPAFASCPDFNVAVTYGNSLALSVVQSDFNGDGIKDLALTHGSSPSSASVETSSVSILLGVAGGGFAAPVYYRTGWL